MNKKLIFLMILVFLLLQGCTVKYYQEKLLESSPIYVNAERFSALGIAECIKERGSRGICPCIGIRSIVTPTSHLSDYEDVLDNLEILDCAPDLNSLKSSGYYQSLSESEDLDSMRLKIIIDGMKNSMQVYNKSAAQCTKDVLLSGTHKNINRLFDLILQTPRDEETESLFKRTTMEESSKELLFKRTDVSDFIENLQIVEAYNGFESLLYCAIDRLARERDPEKIKALMSLASQANYLKEYFRAYFRHGEFIQGKIEVSKLYDRIKNKIREEAPYLSEKQIESIANDLFKKITGKNYASACKKEEGEREKEQEEELIDCKIKFAGKLNSAQFISRSGAVYGFPHITVTIDPLSDDKVEITEIDWNVIGSKVVKVFIEAIGDQYIGIPADPRSTACKIDPSTCFKENVPQFGNISADDFSKVNAHADIVDALVSGVVGKTIRGAGWISLNNEALASMIESLIGTIAKKAAEKVAYCIVSCNKNECSESIENAALEKIEVRISTK
jgi:hypothetical protein